MVRKAVLVFSVLAVFVLFRPSSETAAADDIKARSTLQGLQAAYIQVEPFDVELQKQLRKEGLTRESVQQLVERELEKADIRIVREEDLYTSQGHGVFYVNVQILPPEVHRKYKYTVEGEQISKDEAAERQFYAIGIELRQTVVLLRDPAVQQSAATWSRSSLGFRRISRIEADLKDQIQAFVQACSAANAK